MRYFIVSYNYRDENKQTGFGCSWFSLNHYPSWLEIQKFVKFPEMVILNIIELNEEDYKSFSGKGNNHERTI